MGNQLFFGGRVVGIGDHDAVHRLPPLLRRNADDRRHLHTRVAGEDILHFHRKYVFTAGDDHVLNPVNQVQVAILVEVTHIAGHHPAVHQGGRGLLGLVPVAHHGVLAAYSDLAGFPGRQSADLIVNDLDLNAHRGPADRAATVRQRAVQLMVFRQQQGADGCQFGLAVALHQLNLGNGLHDTLQQSLGHR